MDSDEQRSWTLPTSPPLMEPPSPAQGGEQRDRVDHDRATRIGHERRSPARSAKLIALVASIGTTAGIALAIGATDAGSTDLVESASQPSGGDAGQASPSAGASSTTTTEPSTSTQSTTPQVTEAPAALDGSWVDGVFTGSAQFTRWGDVQVEVTIDGGRIVDVATISAPTGRSSRYTNTSVPRLEAQAIATQDAELDVVSGATYTSRAYADSLQSALDEADQAG